MRHVFAFGHAEPGQAFATVVRPKPLACDYCLGHSPSCRECDGTGMIPCEVCGKDFAVVVIPEVGKACESCRNAWESDQ